MTITNEPVVPNEPVKFKVLGFPEEEAIRGSIERFYRLKPDADKNFSISNAFDEQIFSGVMDEGGKIINLTAIPRQGKTFDAKPR